MITLSSLPPSRRVLSFVAATLFGLAVSAAAPAATLTVNSASDDLAPAGACSLRGAVGAINGGANANGCIADVSADAYGTNDTIVFDASVSGTITFDSGQIVISKNLTINGPGAAVLALDGGGTTRLLYVDGGTALTVAGLTLQKGNAVGSYGGAIEVGVANHALTVRDSVFSGNTANFGGAVDIDATSSTLAVENCAFSGNAANRYGGAIYADTVTVSASTFAGNTAAGGGGAIWADTITVNASTFTGNTAADYYGGAIRAYTATVSASTFSGNTATNQGGAIFAVNLAGNGLTLVNNTAPTGATIFIAGGNGTLDNSLVAGDATVTTAHCASNNSGSITGGTNLEWRDGINETSCGSTTLVAVPVAITALTAIVATTPADNGGPTQTLALPSGSPALGAADAITATLADQRGVVRGASADLGAFEQGTFLTLTGTLPGGATGQTYSGSISTSGGTSPYTYSIAGGSPPSGLMLNSDGTVTGTPTATGTYTFTAMATDSASNATVKDFTITILGGPPSGAAAIPALGPWALLALIGLLGGAGVMRRRK